jgi:hypothetical protein
MEMKNNLYKEYKKNNKILRISYSEIAENPRDFENLGVFVLSHKKYNLVNEIDLNPFDFNTIKEVERYLKNEYNAFIVKPVYMYDHSDITLSFYEFHNKWDSGLVGFVYVTKEAIRENFGIKRITKNIIEKTHELLGNELQMYEDYLSGNVFKYDLIELQKANCCNNQEEILIDSCGGFYGNDFKENGLFDYVNKEEWGVLL